MDAETKLAALWAEAAPSARDPNFAFAVMARIERRRMWGEILGLAPLVVVVGILAWALAPALEHVVNVGTDDVGQLATTGILMAGSVVLGIWLAMGGSRAAIA